MVVISEQRISLFYIGGNKSKYRISANQWQIVKYYIRQDFSPEQVASWLKRWGCLQVSHAWIIGTSVKISNVVATFIPTYVAKRRTVNTMKKNVLTKTFVIVSASQNDQRSLIPVSVMEIGRSIPLLVAQRKGT